MCTHNINGLKNNKNKLHHLLEWAQERHIDIIGILETNCEKCNGPFIIPSDSPYDSYWSPRDRKVKGSSVGLIVNKEWAKHLGFIDNKDPYFIHVAFMFKGTTIHVI